MFFKWFLKQDLTMTVNTIEKNAFVKYSQYFRYSIQNTLETLN